MALAALLIYIVRVYNVKYRSARTARAIHAGLRESATIECRIRAHANSDPLSFKDPIPRLAPC